jgi:dipeptidyl aminopeptidase/acylaminoacyl peptidase
MAFRRWQLARICLFLISLNASVSFVCAQAPKQPPPPDYRPTVEIQQEEFATARSHFKSQILRSGPSPTEWEDLLTPKDAAEVIYFSGNLRLKAWMSRPGDAGKHQAVLFLHPGFDLGSHDWEFTAPLRAAGYIVMLPTTRGENGQHGVFTMYYDEVSDVV